jgi:hypothetical protein
MHFKSECGTTLSPWHDFPLYNGDGTVNFICEIPKDTSAKMEVATVCATPVHCFQLVMAQCSWFAMKRSVKRYQHLIFTGRAKDPYQTGHQEGQGPLLPLQY